MKKNYSFITFIAAIATLAASIFCSCSAMEEDNTGYPLRLQTAVDTSVDIPEEAFSKESPCHVVVFTREKACSPYYFIFEDNAYISGDGQLKWMGKFRYWPGTYCKFVAWWPADANVVLDDTGNIVSADCTLIAISEPYCHFSENPALTFLPYGKDGVNSSRQSIEF